MSHIKSLIPEYDGEYGPLTYEKLRYVVKLLESDPNVRCISDGTDWVGDNEIVSEEETVSLIMSVVNKVKKGELP